MVDGIIVFILSVNKTGMNVVPMAPAHSIPGSAVGAVSSQEAYLCPETPQLEQQPSSRSRRGRKLLMQKPVVR